MSEKATLDEFIGDNEGVLSAEPQGIRLALDESYPKEWGFAELEEVCEVNSGFTWNKEQETDSSEEGAVPVIKIGNVQDGYLDLDDILYLTDVSDEDLRENKARKDWLLMIGSNGSGERVGHCGIIKEDMEFVYASFLYGLHADSDHLLPRFLFYSLNRPKVQQRLTSFTAGSTSLKNLNKSTIENLSIPTSPLPEQRKIATVLYTVDRAIEKTEELINQTERVKAGLTQDLLKSGIGNHQMVETDSRFGLLPDSWELQPLEEVGEIAGRTAPEKDDTECWGGNIPWATPSEITSLVGQTIDDTKEHLTDLALEKVSSNLLPPMSVLMTTRATIGECAVNTVEMTTNQGFKNIIPNERIDTWYTYYRLDYEKDYLASLSKGSTFPEVGKDTVENFVIPIPPIEEQREIGELLRSVDEQILSYKRSKSQYERLKRGLQQDLLSGTVRTTDTNIEVPDEIAQHG